MRPQSHKHSFFVYAGAGSFGLAWLYSSTWQRHFWRCPPAKPVSLNYILCTWTIWQAIGLIRRHKMSHPGLVDDNDNNDGGCLSHTRCAMCHRVKTMPCTTRCMVHLCAYETYSHSLYLQYHAYLPYGTRAIAHTYSFLLFLCVSCVELDSSTFSTCGPAESPVSDFCRSDGFRGRVGDWDGFHLAGKWTN